MATPTRRSKPKTSRGDARTPKRVAPVRQPPILTREDVRTILFDLANRTAPADVVTLMQHEHLIRARAARLEGPAGQLLRDQIALALDCLGEHVVGDCPQIPYYTIALIAAGISYFSNQLDVIPDFLPGIGQLDDAVVMAMACQLARDGLRRYCDWKGRSFEPVARAIGGAPARAVTPRS